MYPEWIMRVHYDSSIDKSIICEIECQKDPKTGQLLDNADFCDINNLHLESTSQKKTLDAFYIHAMAWRWFPIGDSFVDIFSSRDTDSYILEREVDSVNVWLKSTQIAHIMRDNPQHGTAILGGMWGFASVRDRALATKIFSLIVDKKVSEQFNKNGKSPKHGDQSFLARYVHPLVKSSAIVHDSYLCASYGGDPWPTQRKGDCFVGSPSGNYC
jgi:hypothetical protein